MKKYILSLAILAFIFSLLTVSAGSARAYECEPGHLFSIFTGQPCATISSNNTSFNDLKIGSRGERVRAFQQMLKDSGFLYGRVDGIYGRITDSAAKNYYRIYPPTPINTNAPTISGVSGPQTLNVNQTGTWTVNAYDRNGYDLSYTVVWGDEVYYLASDSVNGAQRIPQQSAIFTHSYANAGTYKPTFTVTNKYGQSAKTSLSVSVGNVNPPTPTDSITVISPNGGENWLIGNTESIRWSDSTPTLQCVNCGNTYDIKIQATCTTSMCTEIYRPFMLIAKGVRGVSYSWSVGNTLDFIGSVTNGAYKIQVCQSGTSNCDLSDRYFTITSNATVGVPAISSISPTSGVVGTTVTITGSGFNSSSVVLVGDNISIVNPTYISSNGTIIYFIVPNLQTNLYSIRVSNVGNVSVASGLASNAVNFTVTANTTPYITVLSPNGGETWVKGTTQTIKWEDNTPPIPCPAGTGCFKPSPKSYEITLKPACSSDFCTAVYRESYTIAENVYGSSYNWFISPNLEKMNGAYIIKICQFGTDVCDSSDSYFKISSQAISACPLTAKVISTNLAENNTSWGFDVLVNATNAKTSDRWTTNFQGYVPELTAYGVSKHYGNFFLYSGPLRFTAQDNVDSSCSTTVTVYPPVAPSSSPTISYLSPTYGPVGTTVTVTGSGFSATGNKIRFGNLGVENSPSYNNLSSSDGTHLTFTVPYSNYMACWDSHPACMVAAYTTAPGIYAVSVLNASGKVSNELSFTVTQ